MGFAGLGIEANRGGDIILAEPPLEKFLVVMEIVYRRAKTSKAFGEGLVSLG